MTINVKTISLAIIISSITTSASTLAASDNTINFQGEVTSETCSVAVNGNDASPIVLLPTVSTDDLSSAGSTAGQTAFTVGLSGCAGNTSAETTISTIFVGNNVSSSGNLTNTGSAENVEVQILDPQSSVINLTSGYTSNGDLSLQAGDTSSSADYSAQYYSTGAATAGTVAASLQYAVTYQ